MSTRVLALEVTSNRWVTLRFNTKNRPKQTPNKHTHTQKHGEENKEGTLRKLRK